MRVGIVSSTLAALAETWLSMAGVVCRLHSPALPMAALARRHASRWGGPVGSFRRRGLDFGLPLELFLHVTGKNMAPPTATGIAKPIGDYTLPDGRVVTWIALVRMLLQLEPRRCPDIGTVNAVFGDAKFKSLGEVAQAFDVHPNVVRADWRSLGMPGNPDDGWPIGELFRWHLDRIERRAY